MQRLPPELLQHIFHIYLTLPATVQNISRPTVRHSFSSFSNPITLTHVCRFWRAVACQDPFLWTSILIIGPSREMLPLVDLWLQRAAHFELSLQFVERFFHREAKELTAVSYELFQILWRRRHSWAHIDFRFEEVDDFSRRGDVEALLVDPPPAEPGIRVRTARIIDNRSGEINLTVPLWLNVVNNSHLRSLEVGTWCLDIPPHRNLRELICTRPLDPSHALHFLEHCPVLEKFVTKIYAAPDEDSMLAPEGSLVRDRLRHLEFHSVGYTSSSPVFSALTCPNLEFLSADLHGGTPESLHLLLSFIKRSRCNLRTLKGIDVQYMNKHSVQLVFSQPQFQTIETLLVNDVDDFFCDLLTLPASNTPNPRYPCLPYLRNLDVVEIEASPFKFSNMLMSRFDSLERVQIVSPRPLESLLACDRLWDFPGTISRVDHVEEIFDDLDSLGQPRMTWDPTTLFSALELEPPTPPLSGEEKCSEWGDLWDSFNIVERAGQGRF